MLHNYKDFCITRKRHHTAKFGSHRDCSIINIMGSVCQMISQDHVIKGSFDYMGRSPSR